MSKAENPCFSPDVNGRLEGANGRKTGWNWIDGLLGTGVFYMWGQGQAHQERGKRKMEKQIILDLKMEHKLAIEAIKRMIDSALTAPDCCKDWHRGRLIGASRIYRNLGIISEKERTNLLAKFE